MTYTVKTAPKQRRQSSPSKKASNTPTEPVIVELKLEEPRVRYLKLQPFHRERKIDFHNCKVWKVPELRLCGNWLEAAGFSPEEYVSVTVAKGVMIIRPKDMNGQRQKSSDYITNEQVEDII